MKYLLGCPCQHKIEVDESDERSEIRCPNCHRYVKIPAFDKLPPVIASRAHPQDMIGKTLARRFLITAYLGGGGMGWVYAADDQIVHRQVAIKILKPNYLSPQFATLQKRFCQEAQLASRLVHPAIVLVRSLHRSHQGAYFMVMDFCQGQNLRTILAEKRKLPLTQAVEIARQILEALQIAHDNGIAHRDIKPANIMIEQHGESIQAKILDFGIAKIFSQEQDQKGVAITRFGYRLGSLKYMAPEQILGHEVNAATDIYGVGLLLYQMVSGTLPFSGSKEKVVRDALRRRAPLLSEVCRGEAVKTPWLLDTIVAKALSKHNRRRFHYAREFADLLRYCQPGQRLPAWLVMRWRFAYLRRTLPVAWAAVVCGLLLCALIGALSLFIRPQPYERWLQEAAVQLRQKKYALAHEAWGKALQQNQQQAAHMALPVLLPLFDLACAQGDFSRANEILREISTYADRQTADLWLGLLGEMLLLGQSETLLQERDYTKAKQLLQSEIPTLLKKFHTRQERQVWLDKMLQFHAQKER